MVFDFIFLYSKLIYIYLGAKRDLISFNILGLLLFFKM